MVILPAKMKKLKVKSIAENSELNGSTLYDSDAAVSSAPTVPAIIETDIDADSAQSVAENDPKSKRTLKQSQGNSSKEGREEVSIESVSVSIEHMEGGMEEEGEGVGERSTEVLPMDGWCVVFTGKLSSQSRAEAEQLCVKLGESKKAQERGGEGSVLI